MIISKGNLHHKLLTKSRWGKKCQRTLSWAPPVLNIELRKNVVSVQLVNNVLKHNMQMDTSNVCLVDSVYIHVFESCQLQNNYFLNRQEPDQKF